MTIQKLIEIIDRYKYLTQMEEQEGLERHEEYELREIRDIQLKEIEWEE